MKTLGERLKEERKSKGYTLDQVAKEIGKTNGNVSHWENNRNDPSISDLKKLATLYGCTVSDLIGESTEMVMQLKKRVSQLESVVDYFRGLSGDLGKPKDLQKTAGKRYFFMPNSIPSVVPPLCRMQG